MPKINENLAQQQPILSKTFRQFKGAFTQASRNALPEGSFYQLENVQPIGDANLHTVADLSGALANYGAATIYFSQYVNLNSTDYLINFATNGAIYAYNIEAKTSTQINTGTLLSGAGSRCTQWSNSQILFIDSTGYYHWDGTTFALITGTGVPNGGQDIAVYAGRVWIFSGRGIVVGDANDYTAAAFLATNGAIAINLTDPTLRSNVVRAVSANGYLYFFGVSSINVISNVYIPSGASPPAPLLTNTCIQSTIGTDQPGSVYVIDDRDVYFSNSGGGIYLLRGVTTVRASADIDGTWQYRDPAIPATGGAVTSHNIVCGATLMKRLNDPVFGSDTIVCIFQDGKWWNANYGALTLIVGAIAGNQPALFGFIGNILYQLFANYASSPEFAVMTPLWPMEDPLADKLAVKAGFETTTFALISPYSATLDTESSSTPFLSNPAAGQVQWQNDTGQIVTWQNNALAIVTWYSGQHALNFGTSPSGTGKYLGMTVAGRAVAELEGFYLDYKLGTRWFGGQQ